MIAIALTQSRTVDRVVWISFFTVVTILSAYVYIPLPFTPVPITLQTLAVVASGAVIGFDAIWSQGLYLLLGAFGLPVFAEASGGAQILFGATGGYLFGFVLAGAAAGGWVHPNYSKLTFFGKTWRLFLVSLVIFIPGVLQLCWVLKVSLQKGLELGFYPFLIGDLAKTLTASLIPNRAIRFSI
jgi:biotin transport system substrate-specific component